MPYPATTEWSTETITVVCVSVCKGTPLPWADKPRRHVPRRQRQGQPIEDQSVDLGDDVVSAEALGAQDDRCRPGRAARRAGVGRAVARHLVVVFADGGMDDDVIARDQPGDT